MRCPAPPMALPARTQDWRPRTRRCGTPHGSPCSHEGLAPQNLTMITPEAGNIPGIPEPGSAGSLSGLLSADEPPSGLLTSGVVPTDGKSGDPDSSPSSTAGSSTAGPFD